MKNPKILSRQEIADLLKDRNITEVSRETGIAWQHLVKFKDPNYTGGRYATDLRLSRYLRQRYLAPTAGGKA